MPLPRPFRAVVSHPPGLSGLLKRAATATLLRRKARSSQDRAFFCLTTTNAFLLKSWGGPCLDKRQEHQADSNTHDGTEGNVGNGGVMPYQLRSATNQQPNGQQQAFTSAFHLLKGKSPGA